MPDMKEKLAELLTDCEAKGFWSYGTDSKTGEHGGHEMTAEDIADYLAENIGSKWISVKDRLPSKEEYTAKAEDGTEYYVRLLIAYKTDIVEYEIGYYDGYKWMTEMPIRLIKDVVAWMPFPGLPQPPKGE